MRVKREPASFTQFRTVMKGSRVVIDLTHEDGDAEEHDLGLAGGPFAVPAAVADADEPLKRRYRLQDEDISEALKTQCILFGEWRTAVWNWSREGAAVGATTVDVWSTILFPSVHVSISGPPS